MGEFLTPTKTFTTPNGIVVKQKMIPGAQRPNKLLNTPGNKPLWITIHNTADIDEAAGTNDAEQYARSTFNGRMNGVFVHFYIDETDCWHILPLNEVGYHADDLWRADGGNRTSIAIEIIEETGKLAKDIEAEDRGARLAAWLLHTYGLGIERLTTHQHWNGKYCPYFILPHWNEFRAKVEQYMKELEKPAAATPAAPETPTTTSGKHYRVQVGYFGVKENAETMLKKLKADGYDAFIREE